MKVPDLAKYRSGKVNPNLKHEKPVALVETSTRRKDRLQVLQETSTRLPNFDDLPNFEMYHRNRFKLGNDFIFVSKKSDDTNSLESNKILDPFMNMIAIDETCANEIIAY